MYEEVVALAQKKIVAMELGKAMKKQHISKIEMAKKMNTSRSSVDRLLNPSHYNVTLDTLSRAACALGLHLNISFS
jgi:antitoxin HicB